jgi:hypothetical protein
MYLLTNTGNGMVHINTAIPFSNIKDLQEYLETITSKWDKFSTCPSVFYLEHKIVRELSPQEYKEFIYPHTYNTRSKKCVEQP